jgi:hypothetical protein
VPQVAVTQRHRTNTSRIGYCHFLSQQRRWRADVSVTAAEVRGGTRLNTWQSRCSQCVLSAGAAVASPYRVCLIDRLIIPYEHDLGPLPVYSLSKWDLIWRGRLECANSCHAHRHVCMSKGGPKTGPRTATFNDLLLVVIVLEKLLLRQVSEL